MQVETPNRETIGCQSEMGDHYVPQYYLNGFCEPSTPSIISRYEKGSRVVVTTAVKNVAQETGFYSAEVELYLAEKVEGPANKVLEKIRNTELISSEDKAILSAYMITMLLRVPQSKERLQKQAPEAAKSVRSELDGVLARLIREDPSRADMLEQRRQETKQFLEPYAKGIKGVPKEIWLSLLSPNTFPRAFAALNLMTWRFLIYDKESALLTSDNPVFFFDSMGIGRQQSEVSFPISRTIALWATWHTDSREGFVPTSKQVVHEINRRTVSAATRHVFYSRNERWVLDFINNRGKLKLHRILS